MLRSCVAGPLLRRSVRSRHCAALRCRCAVCCMPPVAQPASESTNAASSGSNFVAIFMWCLLYSNLAKLDPTITAAHAVFLAHSADVGEDGQLCNAQCDDTYVASAKAGSAKLSRMRFASAAGVKPNRRLNSRLNCEGLV